MPLPAIARDTQNDWRREEWLLEVDVEEVPVTRIPGWDQGSAFFILVGIRLGPAIDIDVANKAAGGECIDGDIVEPTLPFMVDTTGMYAKAQVVPDPSPRAEEV